MVGRARGDRHIVFRLYPILGRARPLMEAVRPQIRQYFIEPNTEASPFDRETRDMVYERAAGTKGDEPFGTERDVNAIGYEFLRHSLRARFADDTGEGGISPYHLRGGDLIWEIGSGYFGCRDDDGHFDPAAFAERRDFPRSKRYR